MSDQQSPSPVHVYGLILLALVGTLVFRETPFEPSRPPPADTEGAGSPSQETVPARLWQDPLR